MSDIATEITNSIYHLSAISAQLDTLNKAVGPTDMTQLKTSLAAIKSSVDVLQSSLNNVSSNLSSAKSTVEVVQSTGAKEATLNNQTYGLQAIKDKLDDLHVDVPDDIARESTPKGIETKIGDVESILQEINEGTFEGDPSYATANQAEDIEDYVKRNSAAILEGIIYAIVTIGKYGVRYTSYGLTSDGYYKMKSVMAGSLDSAYETLYVKQDKSDNIMYAKNADGTYSEKLTYDTLGTTGSLLDNDTEISLINGTNNNVVDLSNRVGVPASGQAATLFEAIAEGGGGGGTDEIKEMLQKIIDSQILNVNFDGYVFNSYTPKSVADLQTHLTSVSKIIDNTITSIGMNYAFRDMTGLTYIELNALTSNTATYICNGCSSLTEFHAPNCKTWNCRNSFESVASIRKIYLDSVEDMSNGVYDLQKMTNLNYIYIPNMNGVYTGTTYCPFSSCVNLIDIVTGSKWASSTTFLAKWSPTNALSSTSVSLVDSGETFASNLEKLLYNIREHIAANLQDLTGGTALTITFSSAVKSAINADADTLAAFTNKNWTIA